MSCVSGERPLDVGSVCDLWITPKSTPCTCQSWCGRNPTHTGTHRQKYPSVPLDVGLTIFIWWWILTWHYNLAPSPCNQNPGGVFPNLWSAKKHSYMCPCRHAGWLYSHCELWSSPTTKLQSLAARVWEKSCSPRNLEGEMSWTQKQTWRLWSQLCILKQPYESVSHPLSCDEGSVILI